MMTIPFVDLQTTNSTLKQELLDATERIIDSSDYILGKDLLTFEKDFANFCDTNFALGVGNGLDALKLALLSIDTQQSDEIIVPAHTFIATWLAVSEIGAKIVPVDALSDTMNMDPNAIEQKISSKTKAIVVVHLYGQMCEMDKIEAIAKKHKIKIIEDFAQAQGASFEGRTAGSVGDVNGTSFYPGKNLGSLGDGGALTTNDPLIFEKAQYLRNYGSRIKYEHIVKGVNSRLDNLQAAYLNIKLTHLKAWNTDRQTIAKKYLDGLSDLEGLILPVIHSKATSVFHLFVIRLEKRNELQAFLHRNNIQTLIHYPTPIYQQQAYKTENHGPFPVSTAISNTALSLPIYPGMAADQIAYVILKIKEFFSCK